MQWPRKRIFNSLPTLCLPFLYVLEEGGEAEGSAERQRAQSRAEMEARRERSHRRLAFRTRGRGSLSELKRVSCALWLDLGEMMSRGGGGGPIVAGIGDRGWLDSVRKIDHPPRSSRLVSSPDVSDMKTVILSRFHCSKVIDPSSLIRHSLEEASLPSCQQGIEACPDQLHVPSE